MATLGEIELGGVEYNSPYQLIEFRKDGEVIEGNVKDLARQYLESRPKGLEAVYQNQTRVQKVLPLETLLAHNSIPLFLSIAPPRILFPKTDTEKARAISF